MVIGNIVSEQEVKLNGLFNVTNNIEKIDKKIPTLVIGWDFSKRIFNDRKLSILDKKIEHNISWTFTKREKRYDNEKDLECFMRSSIKKIDGSIKYYYVNILTTKYSTIKKIIKKLTSDEISSIYVYQNSFIYIYTSGVIIGIDFNAIDFINIERKKIYRLLYSNGNQLTFKDDFIPIEVRENIGNNKKLIAYLFKNESRG